jgi:hypothetical protein
MPIHYIEFERDPDGLHPAHLRPAAGVDAAQALNAIREAGHSELNVLVQPDGQREAYAVVRYPGNFKQLVSGNLWREVLSERSIKVAAIEPVLEHAEVSDAGKYWRLGDRGSSGWTAVTIDHRPSPAGLVCSDGDRHKQPQALSEVGGFFRPRN